jgi:hypothetical protein
MGECVRIAPNGVILIGQLIEKLLDFEGFARVVFRSPWLVKARNRGNDTWVMLSKNVPKM